MKNNVYFISGIDTNIGKSYATGILAYRFMQSGKKVITQKLIQTGNEDYSEDIELHRKLMGVSLQDEDLCGLTMPEIFPYPASPHLASRLAQRAIDFEKIESATQALSQRYDIVLVEGAGGLMVPLTEQLLTIDYIAEKGYPLIFVTSGRLGSINHTLLSLEAIERRNIPLQTLVYNCYPSSSDPIIQEDTRSYIEQYLRIHFPGAEMIIMREEGLD